MPKWEGGSSRLITLRDFTFDLIKILSSGGWHSVYSEELSYRAFLDLMIR